MCFVLTNKTGQMKVWAWIIKKKVDMLTIKWLYSPGNYWYVEVWMKTSWSNDIVISNNSIDPKSFNGMRTVCTCVSDVGTSVCPVALVQIVWSLLNSLSLYGNIHAIFCSSDTIVTTKYLSCLSQSLYYGLITLSLDDCLLL